MDFWVHGVQANPVLLHIRRSPFSEGKRSYDFYETPQRETRLHNENTPVGFDFTAAVQKQTQAVQKEAPEDIEININNTNIKNTGVEKQVSPPPSEFYF